jgi:DNA-directed RNA polymerase subunit F
VCLNAHDRNFLNKLHASTPQTHDMYQNLYLLLFKIREKLYTYSKHPKSDKLIDITKLKKDINEILKIDGNIDTKIIDVQPKTYEQQKLLDYGKIFRIALEKVIDLKNPQGINDRGSNIQFQYAFIYDLHNRLATDINAICDQNSSMCIYYKKLQTIINKYYDIIHKLAKQKKSSLNYNNTANMSFHDLDRLKIRKKLLHNAIKYIGKNEKLKKEIQKYIQNQI